MNFPRTGLLVFAFMLLGGAARASDSFPDVIKSELKIASAPPCTICHATLTGGLGTVTRPFGQAMQRAGLTLADEDKLRELLRKFEADGTDTDGDGVPDIAELRAGTDPGVANASPSSDGGGGGATVAAPPDPRYGCGAHIVAPRGAAYGPLAIAAAMIALRRRRRSAPSRNS